MDCIVLDDNTEFTQACQDTTKQEQSKLKKSFAVFSRTNKERREKRLEEASQAKQAAFERKKQKLMER